MFGHRTGRPGERATLLALAKRALGALPPKPGLVRRTICEMVELLEVGPTRVGRRTTQTEARAGATAGPEDLASTVKLINDSIMAKPAIDLSTMTPSEKLELIDELWQCLGPDDFALTSKQRQELDRRLDRLERDGPSGSPWLEVRERIEKASR